MLFNHLKFALRLIKKNKLYSFLNILGLSIGLACFFVIYLFIKNETSYDQHHLKSDRIYRAIKTIERDTGVEIKGELTGAMAPVVADQIPQIEAYSRIGSRDRLISLPAKPDSTFKVFSTSVDLGFVQMFDLEFITGSKKTSFQTKQSAIISEKQAERIFGSAENAIDQELIIGKTIFRIDGVVKETPANSSIKYTLLLPFSQAEKPRGARLTNWYANFNDQSYFLLKEGSDAISVGRRIDKIFQEKVDFGINTISLQKLSDVHFSLDVKDQIAGKSDRQYIFVFSFVAIFILLSSVFNYVSLALLQSAFRVKEIGVRKVLGANRKQLLQQYAFESIVYVVTATVVAIVLVEFATPILEALLDKSIQFSFLESPDLILKALIFAILLALLASLYPAYVCLKLQAVNMLRGFGNSFFSSQQLIKIISVFQIIIFITLICSAFVARKQMEFMRNENLGFDNERMLVLRMATKELYQKSEVLKNELKQLPNVERIAFASAIPTILSSSTSFAVYDFTFHNFDIDEDYLEIMGMKLISGRNFSPSDADTASIILINKTAAIKLDIIDNPIGKLVNGKRIVGVVSDFHFISKKQPIEAVMFRMLRGVTYGNLILKLKSDNLEGTLSAVQEKFESITAQSDMDFFFLDDQFNNQYKHETIMTTMINVFTFLAALVAFIGLFGISGYSVSRRLKEMGIRKVLGASFIEIQKKLNYSNLIKIFVAILIAIPLTVYWMDSWLNSFAYRIEMPIWVLATAALTATLVILLTVSIHSVKAYFINPIEILKDE